MFVRITACAALLGGVQLAAADLVQLRDKASVTGKVLAEKRDAVVIDIGYTVLVIPRNQIAKISKTDETPGPAKPASTPKTTDAATAEPPTRKTSSNRFSAACRGSRATVSDTKTSGSAAPAVRQIAMTNGGQPSIPVRRIARGPAANPPAHNNPKNPMILPRM